MDFIFISLVATNIIFFIISLYNLYTAPKVVTKVNNSKDLFISILIPARNEEKNIGKILDDILKQSYKNYEVIVLNDNSYDETEKIIQSYIVKDKRIKLINGKDLPNDWLGKNYACHQLSKNANGDLLLFIDADVSLNEIAIESVLEIYTEKKVKMISIFPTQIIPNFLTYLIVPMMNWILLTFLPLKKVYTSANKSFVAANGQFILIDKKLYFKIGGHESVKNKIVEDMELARILKKEKIKIITLLGNNIVKCKMYSSFKESFSGFSKNFFVGFNTSAFSFISLLIFIEYVFMLPFILVFYELKFSLILLIIVLSRVFTSFLSNQKIFINLILHPLQMIIIYILGINSMILSYLGKLEWKGRRL